MPANLLDCIPHMVLRCDATGEVLWVNNKWENYTGLSFSQTQKHGWIQAIFPEEVEKTRTEWEKFKKDKSTFSMELRLRKAASDEYRWHGVSGSFGALMDGQIQIVITFTDIHLEKTLCKEKVDCVHQEEVFSRRVKHSSDPILTVDAKSGAILTFNRSAEKHFHYTQEEIIGKPYTILMDEGAARRHEGPDGYHAKYQQNARIGHAVAIGTSRQVHARRKDGELIPVTLIVDSYVKDEKRVYIIVLRVVTPELTVQRELLHSKDAFLSTMSHELRTPLFGLLGTMSLLPPMPTEELQEDMHNMQVCVLHLLSIVNNMVDFYLLEHLRTTPTLHPFQPSQLFDGICAKWEGCENPGVSFAHVLDEDVPNMAVGDPNFIEHIVANLLSNAMRFTHQGSVKLEIGVANPESSSANLHVHPGQTLLKISITDTGIGIDPMFYPQVFKPFCQVDDSNSRQYGGVGLGLAVSKCLVDLLGGVITFKSSLGQGSEFTVLIPVDVVEVDSPRGRKPSSNQPETSSATPPTSSSPPTSTPPPPSTASPSSVPPAVPIPPVQKEPPDPLLTSPKLSEPPPPTPVTLDISYTQPSPPLQSEPPPIPPFQPSQFNLLASLPSHPPITNTTGTCPFSSFSMPPLPKFPSAPTLKAFASYPQNTLKKAASFQHSPRLSLSHPPSSPPPPAALPNVQCATEMATPSSATPSLFSFYNKSEHSPFASPISSTPSSPLSRNISPPHPSASFSSPAASSAASSPVSNPPVSTPPAVPPLSIPFSTNTTSSIPSPTIPSEAPATPSRPSSLPITIPSPSSQPPTPPSRPPLSPSALAVLAVAASPMVSPASSTPPTPTSTPSTPSLISSLTLPKTPFPPTVPLKRSAFPKAMQAPSSELNLLALKVLIVEDNAMNIHVIKKMLARIGCESTVAHHGKEALDILFGNKNPGHVGYDEFDVVLMDCQMPVLDGFQTTKYIRSWEKEQGASHMKVYALTASTSAENENECIKAGMDAFIAKPVTMQGLYHYLASQD